MKYQMDGAFVLTVTYYAIMATSTPLISKRCCNVCGKHFDARWQPVRKCWAKGCSEACRRELISASKRGERNPNWKSNGVGYSAIHFWIRYRRPKCQRCETPLLLSKPDYGETMAILPWSCLKELIRISNS